MPSRPLRAAQLAVDNAWLYVADDAFPVVAQLNRRTGDLERIVRWEISDQHRDQVASTALLADGDSLWVSSPLAGGMVRVDIATGRVTIIALDATPGPIVAAGETLWVVADANWRHDASAIEGSIDPERRRPVVWADSPIDLSPPWVEGVGAPPADTQLVPELDEDRDDFSWDTPRPIWRVVDRKAERADLGGDISQLTSLPDGALIAVLRRLDDPVVKTPQGLGSVSYTYPGALARCAEGDAPVVLVELPDTSGSLFIDGEQCWICGFGLESRLPAVVPRTNPFGEDPTAVHELDLQTGELALSTLTMEPDAIVDGVAVTISRTHASRFRGGATRCEAHCYDLAWPAEPTRLELPRVVNTYEGVIVSAGAVWIVAESRDAVVWVDPSSGTTGEIPIDVDIGPGAPTPTRPVGVDLDQFENAQLAALRASFQGGWTDEDGTEYPFIDGIDFDSIELRGGFPDSHIVARFRALPRPGISFARRWNLYDELGNTQDLEYADIHLMEDIESGGLPPAEACQPDGDGVVWF